MNDSEKYPSLWDLTNNKYDQPPNDNHDLEFTPMSYLLLIVWT
jgi:hypothetical protein